MFSLFCLEIYILWLGIFVIRNFVEHATLNQNLSVPYRVGLIWISAGYREQELIRFLQSRTHLDTRWAHSTRIYPFLTELDTFGYQVGTFNKNLSVPCRVGLIWISAGYREQELIRFLQSRTHLDTRWAHSTRIYPFPTELDTFGYQVDTGNKNSSVSYRVEHFWTSCGYREQEFIRWTHLDIRWVQWTSICPFLKELDTFGYRVGTGNQHLSVPYRVGHIWIAGGYSEPAFFRSLQRYKVGTWKQSNYVPYRVRHIWISGGYRETFIHSLQRRTHLSIRWVHGNRVILFLTELDTIGYQVGTGTRIYPLLTKLNTSGTRWAYWTRIYTFLTELDTFGYQVGTGNQHLSVLYRGEYIWVPGGHIETAYSSYPTSSISFNHPWKRNAKDGEKWSEYSLWFHSFTFHFTEARHQNSYPRWWKQSYDKIFRWSQLATWICTSLRWRPETGRIFLNEQE